MGWAARAPHSGERKNGSSPRRIGGRYLVVLGSTPGQRRSWDGRRYLWDGKSLRRAVVVTRAA
jgi:hypothetical protein